MTALPFFLGHLRFSAACHAAGYLSRVPHLADSGWLLYSCSGRLAWGWGCLGTDVLIPHLVFYLVPAQLPLPLLPLWGSAPLAGVSACLSPVCWSTPGVGLEGSFAMSLGFLPCAMLSLLFLGSSCSACLQGWVGLCTLCQGAPVVVVCLLGLQVRSPCCTSLTLG